MNSEKQDVDRYLVSGALALLLIQVTVLLADLKVVELPFLSRTGSHADQPVIGQILYTKRNVRRRSHDSLIWEETEREEPLRAYDAVLTLSSSAAQLRLQGDVKIQLHENTLVVVEPPDEARDGELRLKFDRGNVRSHNPTQRLALGSGAWMMEARAGSDLSLRSLEGDRIEVEVAAGEVVMANRASGETRNFAEGKRLVLDAHKVAEEKNVSRELRWSDPKDQRIYTHDGLAVQTLRWDGNARRLRVLEPSRAERWIPLLDSQREIQIPLNSGTYAFSLESEDGASSTVNVSVLPAPRIRYFTPLPRDRVKTETKTLFAWSPISSATSYRLEIVDAATGKVAHGAKAQAGETDLAVPREGDFQWRVLGLDEDGFEIPAHHVYPIYIIEEPLAAPKLQAPELRAPASPKNREGPPDSSWWRRAWDILWPRAHASESELRSHKIVFSWFPVAGADHYVIEISSNPDFREPELIEKVSTERFEWKGFERKVYYWRVAAGKSNGKKGLFSEAARADLSTLSQLKLGELAPGVEYAVDVRRPAPPKRLPPQPSLPPTPPEPPPPAAPVRAAPAPVAEAPPPVAPPPQPLPEDSQLLMKIWAGTAWQSLDLEGPDRIRASFAGPPKLEAGGTLNFPLQNRGSLLVHWRSSLFEWTPDSRSRLPLQGDLDDIRATVALMYRRPRSFWTWGLIADRAPLLERASLEELKLKETWSYGLAGERLWRHNRLHGRHAAGLLAGPGFRQAIQNNQIDFFWNKTGPVRFLTGADVEFRVFVGDALAGPGWRGGVHLGFEW